MFIHAGVQLCRGLAWHSIAWCGVVWCGVAWHSIAWRGVGVCVQCASVDWGVTVFRRIVLVFEYHQLHWFYIIQGPDDWK